MSIRRSIAAAVFVAAVSAPTVLGATQAMADTAPTPGTSQPDAPAPAEPAPADPAPAADPVPANPVPAQPPVDAEETALRARLAALIAEPGHSTYFYKAAQKAAAGTVADVRKFLDVERPTIELTDRLLKVSQIMSVAEDGSPLQKAAGAVLDAPTIESADHFLHVTWPAAASDNRVRVSQLLEDKTLGRLAREGAEKAIDGTDMEVAAFLQELPGLRLSDDRVRIAQIIATGGPEVRKAGRAALEDGSPEAIRAFLKDGWAAAKAEDAAAEQANQNNQNGQGNQGGSTVTPVADTTTATPTPTPTAQSTGTQLAATGADAPLGTLAVGGATALLLGAGALVAARRKQQQD